MALTLAEVRQHVNTALDDPAVQRLIDDAYGEIERRYGVLTEITKLVRGGGTRLFPTRPIDEGQTITVKETVADVVTTLAADDFRVWHGGRMIERLDDGTNPRTTWGHPVEITYTPIGDARDRVAVDLVKLAIQYEGVKSESIDAYSSSNLDYDAERERLLASLAPSRVQMA